MVQMKITSTQNTSLITCTGFISYSKRNINLYTKYNKIKIKKHQNLNNESLLFCILIYIFNY